MPKLIDTDSLFEATVREFAAHGYAATTTQQIATSAGINEVTLFRRWGSKAGLIEAALTHCLQRSPFGRLTASEDARADLVAIVTAYAATYRAYGGAVLTLLTEIPRHPELKSVISVLLPNMRSAAAIIADHQRRGGLRCGDPMQKMALLIAPVMTAGLWARTGAPMPANLDAEAIVEAFLEGHGFG